MVMVMVMMVMVVMVVDGGDDGACCDGDGDVQSSTF